jgi:hypothetical protein
MEQLFLYGALLLNNKISNEFSNGNGASRIYPELANKGAKHPGNGVHEFNCALEFACGKELYSILHPHHE